MVAVSKSMIVLVATALLVAAIPAGATSFPRRSILQAPAPAPGEGGVEFDWGRPCTLVGNSSEVEITGPDNALCTNCGSGATATPEPTCIFKNITVPVGYTLEIHYHSSTHHLFLGDTPCAYTTEVCANATAAVISEANPCKYTFSQPGTYYISDDASNPTDASDFCHDFGAYLGVIVSSSS